MHAGKALAAAEITDARREWVRVSSAMIRYYFKEDPDGLSDSEWAARLQELKFIRKAEKGD